MIRECFAANSGIQFEAERLHEVGLDPHALYPHVKPRPPALPVSSIICSPEEREKEKRPQKKDLGEELLCKLCHVQEQSHSDVDHAVDEDNKRALADEDGEECHEEMNEEHEELHDSLSPHFDQLEKKRLWWLLEYLPLVHLHTKEDGDAMKVISLVLLPTLSRVMI